MRNQEVVKSFGYNMNSKVIIDSIYMQNYGEKIQNGGMCLSESDVSA
jgi:hypothetical protein